MTSKPATTPDAHSPSNRAVAPRPAAIAVIGNPNTGKTTLFNALTGYRRRVANYPGVTVDLARGPIRNAPRAMELLDLPGTYSLSAVSPDELVVSNVLCGRIAGRPRPDCILAIVDASNLPRNLYLLSQLIELDLPVVVALNMSDVAAARGIKIEAGLLSERLGVEVVPVVATRESTVRPLIAAIDRALLLPPPKVRAELPPPLAAEIGALSDGRLRPAEVLRVLLDPDGSAEQQFVALGGSGETLRQSRARLERAGIDAASEVRARYAWVARVLDGAVRRPARPVRTFADRVDALLTHRLLGGVALLLVLFALFQSIFAVATYPMDAIDRLFGWLGEQVGAALPEGVVNSLVVDGVIGGVGGVLVFLPQILILFAFIAVLEDCGYMARAASMMDRAMRALGLSGRSFIPLLSSFACAVPAIMGTRSIADRRERFVTILIAPFMSCSARLPVYVLLIAAFVPSERYLGGLVGRQGLVMLAMYLVGVVVAIPAAWLLKKTAFAGPKPTFVLELPRYKWPRPRAIWQRMYFSGRSFVVRAGSVILAVNLIVWALGYFPRDAAVRTNVARQAAAAGWDEERESQVLSGEYLRASYLGRMGRAIEPVIEPIGWDWRVGMAVIASFPAREVVIGALGTIYNLGGEVDEKSAGLRDALHAATWPDSGRPVFTLPVALSLMVFFALCAQCSSTLVIIGRETGSWLWPIASFVGMTTIAYFAAWGVSAATSACGW